MIAYWISFAIPLALALTNWPQGWGRFAKYVYIILFIALTVFIGFRFSVGGDWFNYEVIYLVITRLSLNDSLSVSDPAYSFINWTIGQFGGEVWHVNLVCALLFSYALLRFIDHLPSPATALVSALPTMIIVIAMGYTRQSCAVSCIMIAATTFRGRFELTWVAWLVLGVAFHKSAIFVLPLFFLAASENRILSAVMGGVMGIGLLTTLILGNIQALLIIYVEAEQQSSGAAARVALTVTTGVVFLLLPNKREIYGQRYTLWRNMAIASLALIPAFVLIQSSTIVDRISILFVPLQLVVFGGLSRSITTSPILKGAVIIAVSAFQLATLTIWIYFSVNSSAWIPYRNILFEQYI